MESTNGIPTTNEGSMHNVIVEETLRQEKEGDLLSNHLEINIALLEFK